MLIGQLSRRQLILGDVPSPGETMTSPEYIMINLLLVRFFLLTEQLFPSPGLEQQLLHPIIANS